MCRNRPGIVPMLATTFLSSVYISWDDISPHFPDDFWCNLSSNKAQTDSIVIKNTLILYAIKLIVYTSVNKLGAYFRVICAPIRSWSDAIYPGRHPFKHPKRRLIVRSGEDSKSGDLYLELSDRSEIWQAFRQHCWRCACKMSKRYENLKYQSRGFDTSRDLTIRRLFGYWDGALAAGHFSWASTWWRCPRCLP